MVSAMYTFGYGKNIDRCNEVAAIEGGGFAIVR